MASGDAKTLLRYDMMRPNRPIYLLLMAAVGCTKTTESDVEWTDEAGSQVTVQTCDVTVRETIPSTGSMEHYYRDPIVFKLSGPVTEANILSDIVGDTAISEDGQTVTFTPTGTLSPSTEYSVALEYCYGTPEITFTTSNYGAPIEDGTVLEGTTFVLNFDSGEYTTGENAGDLLNSVFTRNSEPTGLPAAS